MSKKREKHVKWHLSYGFTPTRVGVERLKVAEEILLKYNEHIVLRIKDYKKRDVMFEMDGKDFDLIVMDIKTVISVKDHTTNPEAKFTPTIRLFGDGVKVLEAKRKEIQIKAKD